MHVHSARALALRHWGNFTLYVVTAVRIAAVAFFFFDGIIHHNRYTYWNYTLQSMFYLGLTLSQLFRLRSLEHWLLVYGLPVVYGSVVLVMFFIIIILYLDDGWLFFLATREGGGAYTLGTIHAADAFIHYFPLVDLGAWLLSNLMVVRCTLRGYMHEVTCARICGQEWIGPLLYRLYFYVSPGIPLLVYALFYDPFVEYPVPRKYSQNALVFLAIALGLVIMLWLFETLMRHFCPMIITGFPCHGCWYPRNQCVCVDTHTHSKDVSSSQHCCAGGLSTVTAAQETIIVADIHHAAASASMRRPTKFTTCNQDNRGGGVQLTTEW